MLIGILTGLSAALLQSVSYLITRNYVHHRHAHGPHASRQLLTLGHVWMCLASAIILLFAWPYQGIDIIPIIEPTLQMTVFYLIGQSSTTFALRYTEPSRLSPLMGLKIVCLATLASFLVQPHPAGTPAPPIGLTLFQWLAVGLSVVAAVGLNFSGAALRKRAIGWIILACVAYSYADWNITRTNMAIYAAAPGCSLFQATLVSTGLCYGLAGLVGVAFLPVYGSRKWKDWSDAAPFAGIWIVAMVFLYWCFSEVGPLLGNILQSTRGLMSILIASLLIRHGHLHIEPAATRRAFARRIVAGILMFTAVTLYVWGDPRNQKRTAALESPRPYPGQSQPPHLRRQGAATSERLA